MRVASVNIGGRSTLLVRGVPVDTGALKTPMAGPVLVGPEGLSGDVFVTARRGGRADQAVSVYAREHYPFWEAELGIEPLPEGTFSENLTVQGALEERVRVGEVWRCGEAVLQVAQPRLPCSRLDARLGRPVLRRFLESLRTGFYLRVLRPGLLAAGDPVEVVEAAEAGPTVREFTRLSQIDYWDADGLRGLLAAPGLASEWARAVEEKVQRGVEAEGWAGTRPLLVQACIEESLGVVSYELVCAAGRPLPPLRGGEVLYVVCESPGERGFTRLACALSGEPGDTTRYRITVRTRGASGLAGGRVASVLPLGLPPGMVIRAAPPRRLVALPAPEGGPLALLTEGLGLALALTIAEGAAGLAPMRLLHCDINGAAMPFRARLERLVGRGLVAPRVHFRHPLPTDREGADYAAAGWPGSEALATWLLVDDRATVLVAGSEPFVTDAVLSLERLGVPPARVLPVGFGAGAEAEVAEAVVAEAVREPSG